MPGVLYLWVPVKTLAVATSVLLLFCHICHIVVGLLLVDKLRHNQPLCLPCLYLGYSV